jgi:hypothetical protein
MDPGRKKFQISRNQTKPFPLCSSCRAYSNHMLFSKNGYRMQKLLRSEFQVKHAKRQSQSQKVKVN